MRNFKQEELAVSPVIGVILMVAITVILAAVVAAFVFGTSNEQQKPPTASITATNNPDTTQADIRIKHNGGDVLVGGGWKLSIVTAGNGPQFIAANSTSFLKVGDQVNVQNTTVNSNWLSNSSLNGGGTLSRSVKYDVKLIQFPSEVLLLDEIVEVR